MPIEDAALLVLATAAAVWPVAWIFGRVSASRRPSAGRPRRDAE